jgi:hypothetical protein
MPTNLTGQTISSTYGELLHVSGGPDATLKSVYSGTGTATALNVSTLAVSVDNIKLDGNTVSTTDTNGNLNLAPNGTGTVAIGNAAITGGTITGITDLAIADGGTGASTAANARTNLGLGTMATQAASAVAITGGTVSGVTFSGSFSGMALVEATTLATGNAAAGCNLAGATLAADGTDANIDLTLTPKGTGSVNISKIAVTAGTVPYNTLTGLAHGEFWSTADQSTTADTATAITFTDSAGHNAGITLVSSSQITLAAAGIYRIMVTLQFANSDTADRTAFFWFRKNGTDITASASKIAIPKSADGGAILAAVEILESVTAGQYIECYWAPDNAAVTLENFASISSPYVRPAIPSVILTAVRIG